MWWRLKHRLFGWHYVHIRNSATEEIRRVFVLPSGERYVKYFSHRLVYIDRKDCGWVVTPLTWIEPVDGVPNLKVVNG